MFAGLESIRENPARRWTAMLSFTVQAVIAAVALVIPLVRPQGLPEAFVRRPIFVPVSSGYAPAQPAHAAGPSSGAVHLTPLIVSTNRTFSFHPAQNQNIGTEVPQAPNLSFGTPGVADGVPNSISTILARPVPRPLTVVRAPRMSVMMQGNLVRRIEPVYPAIAKLAGVQGTVVIKAVISRTGLIEQEQVISGPALLAQAALDAVRQWKYRPYYLNSEAIEVETQITVNFVLNR